jgi:hypothetical protein
LKTISPNKIEGKLMVTGGYMEFGTLYSGSAQMPVPENAKVFPHLSADIPVSSVEKSVISVDGKQIENYVVGCNAADCFQQFSYFTHRGEYYEMHFDIAGGGLGEKANQILSSLEFTD